MHSYENKESAASRQPFVEQPSFLSVPCGMKASGLLAYFVSRRCVRGWTSEVGRNGDTLLLLLCE